MATKTLAKGSIPLRERRVLTDEWEHYARAILPAGAPDVQKVETRRAFYAGAAALFTLMTGGLDEDSEPTELDIAFVEVLSQELAAFGRDLAAGRA